MTSKLTDTQKLAAAELRKERPEVFTGTNVIRDAQQRHAFYERVRAVMNTAHVSPVGRDEFCDRAGVPD